MPFGHAFGTTDPRIGSWTLLSAQSTLTPPNTLTVTPMHDQVHVVISGETHLDFTAKANGHDTAVTGNPGFDEVMMRRVGRKATEVTEKKAGAVVATVVAQAFSDGKQLLVTTKTSGHADQVAVWTRTGGGKVAGDPIAGEWMQDQSKTRLRQGLALKIEPDGDGGVRFSSDFSYTARLDGKQYDVHNSRNDSVTLALVDPHTVDAVYRRDDQITQRDRWVVSPDGQQMSLTRTATLENGQHLAEKLVFKKQ
jgi:isopentenyldiphosphate isomerase